MHRSEWGIYFSKGAYSDAYSVYIEIKTPGSSPGFQVVEGSGDSVKSSDIVAKRSVGCFSRFWAGNWGLFG